MKVLFLPASPNPYQRELIAGLRELGVEAEVGEPQRFLPVLRAMAAHGWPNILHLHWIDPLALGKNPVMTALKGLRLIGELGVLRLRGVRVVWTVHNLMDHEQRSPQLQMLINRAIALLSHRLIVHSRSAQAIVGRAFRVSPNRLSVVPHASFRDTYENCISKEDARRKLDLPQRALVFLHFGVLREYKNTKHLIHGFQKTPLPEARLLVAGRPGNEELAASIQTAADEDERIVANLCYIPDEDVQLYLNASDVLVMPYKESLTSGVALLAIGFGKPVIAPRTAVMEEVLEPAANLLYDQMDTTALRAAMEKAERSDLRAMGEKNFRKGSELSWQKMAAQTKAVYGAVLGVSENPYRPANTVKRESAS